MELVDFIVVPIIIILSGLTGSMITLNYIRSHSIPKAKVDNTLANGNFTNALHPLVKDIYELFVDDKTVNSFKQGYCEILVNEIRWWSANEVYDREFRFIPVDIQKKYNATIKEINNSLSLADKKVLDHITQQVITNNKEFINRLFL
jgi:hypothetical protein